MNSLSKALAAVLGVVTGSYTGYIANAYLRYGRVCHCRDASTLLDTLMPDCEVRENHHVTVNAPMDVVLAAAREVSFQNSSLVQLIFALRQVPSRLVGATVKPVSYQPMLEEVVALGWRQIGEVPGRQIVMGAVTQPWKQDVEFRALSSEEFTSFDEPGYAKIAWTLEVEPIDANTTVFRTETRVGTTDPDSREKFRRYWSFLSPGIILIRYEMLRLVKAEAEQRIMVVPALHSGEELGRSEGEPATTL